MELNCYRCGSLYGNPECQRCIALNRGGPKLAKKVTKRWECVTDTENYILLCEGEIDGRTYSVGKAVPIWLWGQCIKRYMLESLVLRINGDIQLLVDRLERTK